MLHVLQVFCLVPGKKHKQERLHCPPEPGEPLEGLLENDLHGLEKVQPQAQAPEEHPVYARPVVGDDHGGLAAGEGVTRHLHLYPGPFLEEEGGELKPAHGDVGGPEAVGLARGLKGEEDEDQRGTKQAQGADAGGAEQDKDEGHAMQQPEGRRLWHLLPQPAGCKVSRLPRREPARALLLFTGKQLKVVTFASCDSRCSLRWWSSRVPLAGVLRRITERWRQMQKRVQILLLGYRQEITTPQRSGRGGAYKNPPDSGDCPC
mmetsp:Transcript_26721/g.67425  ORF Transcript_26721/g.67425 Transcript_26721/m.67425 type:complete len:262 (-) Transcript_26721:90-875(-)